ncbi:MAG TPA: hypothetical protein HA227_01885 [Candidatus Diapherotrites archaeon]|uniref:Uncharacterized protein n=1 Tax=Candidatus Iainarchaeum sp. TaxID=3101447 RepID=A0A7J4KSI1_9ARCH|nr:hypothetical protein [Candidatus Diapherotrites archaeon]
MLKVEAVFKGKCILAFFTNSLKTKDAEFCFPKGSEKPNELHKKSNSSSSLLENGGSILFKDSSKPIVLWRVGFAKGFVVRRKELSGPLKRRLV